MKAPQRSRTRTDGLGDARIVRDDTGREVVMFTTPSGVTAVVDTSFSDATLAKLARSLKRKIRRTELRLARRVLAQSADKQGRKRPSRPSTPRGKRSLAKK
jgi:hypothetical protein